LRIVEILVGVQSSWKGSWKIIKKSVRSVKPHEVQGRRERGEKEERREGLTNV